jgi:DNA polymerase
MGFFKFLITCKGYKIAMPEELMLPVILQEYEALKSSVEWWAESNAHQLAESGMSLQTHLHELMFCKRIITLYRQKFPGIVKFWADMESSAIAAVENKGQVIPCGKLLWLYDDSEFLWLRLPSGRKLAYREPVVKDTVRWGKPARVLTFMAMGENRRWVRQSTYGGALVENATQATARDIMAEAMLRLDEKGYPPVLTVHDEVVSEKEIGYGSHEEFCQLLSSRPEWASDLPLKVAGWKGTRYKKG